MAPSMSRNGVRRQARICGAPGATFKPIGNPLPRPASLRTARKLSLGRQGKRVSQNGTTEVWARPLADGSTAVALFNRGDQSAAVAVSWQQLGIDGPRRVRDLW